MTIDTKYIRAQISRASPLPWMLATSNSWCRIVDASHAPVCSPCNQPDGHPDLLFAGGSEGVNADLLLRAVNTLPALLDELEGAQAHVALLKASLNQATGEAEESGRALTLAGKVNKRLTDEVLRLHGVLQKIAGESTDEGGCYYTNRVNIGRARAALQGEPKC